MFSRFLGRRRGLINHIIGNIPNRAQSFTKEGIEGALTLWGLGSKKYRPLYQTFSTHFRTKASREEVVRSLEHIGGKLSKATLINSDDSKSLEVYYALLSWKEAIVTVDLSLGAITFQIWSFDKTLLQKIYDTIFGFQAIEEEKGDFYVLCSGANGITTTWLGKAKSPLVRENYLEECLEAFDFLREQFVSSKPHGRIAILAGPPGAGKSHFIRGLSNSTNARFLMVPANLIGNLTGPGMIGTLNNLANPTGGKKRPTVLVLEDCDGALVKREQGSLAALAELLNLADGILGELLDIKIIASTNAKYIDLDPAIVRPGRLMRMIEFGALPPNKATDVLRRIAPEKKDISFTKPEILANIYSLAQVEGVHKGPTSTEIRTGAPTRSGTYL